MCIMMHHHHHHHRCIVVCGTCFKIIAFHAWLDTYHVIFKCHLPLHEPHQTDVTIMMFLVGIPSRAKLLVFDICQSQNCMLDHMRDRRGTDDVETQPRFLPSGQQTEVRQDVVHPPHDMIKGRIHADFSTKLMDRFYALSRLHERGAKAVAKKDNGIVSIWSISIFIDIDIYTWDRCPLGVHLVYQHE